MRQTFGKKRTQTLTDNAEYTLWSTMKTKSNDLFLNDRVLNRVPVQTRVKAGNNPNLFP